MKKKIKHEGLPISGTDLLDGISFDKIDQLLDKIKREYPNHRNFHFSTHYYYKNTEIEVWADRLETDEEFAERKKRSEAAKKVAKVKKKKLEEIALYKKLAKKYEGKV